MNKKIGAGQDEWFRILHAPFFCTFVEPFSIILSYTGQAI